MVCQDGLIRDGVRNIMALIETEEEFRTRRNAQAREQGYQKKYRRHHDRTTEYVKRNRKRRENKLNESR